MGLHMLDCDCRPHPLISSPFWSPVSAGHSSADPIRCMGHDFDILGEGTAARGVEAGGERRVGKFSIRNSPFLQEFLIVCFASACRNASEGGSCGREMVGRGPIRSGSALLVVGRQDCKDGSAGFLDHLTSG